ncbi:MAG: site-2 protease family protein [Acidimicrobiales bacterium]|nr:site-2 protease family protein [Acidimicrobiales bacterium]
MQSLTVGRIRGIEIRVNWSVLVIAALVTASLAETVLPSAVEEASTTEYWVAASLTSIAFFVSLLAHELGHALVAARHGVGVSRIDLWLFGGVAHLTSRPKTPGVAARIAVAGPLVSIALGLILLIVQIRMIRIGAAAIAWLGLINLVLAGFNLLPALPLDGGRIFQAWRWHKTGSERQGTSEAVRLSLVISGTMIGLGVIQVLMINLTSGLWTVLIAWFIREAARVELDQTMLEGPLKSTTVAELMSPEPAVVDADETLDELVTGTALRHRHAAFPVVDADGHSTGLVTMTSVQRQPRDTWSTLTVGDLATPLTNVATPAPGDSVADLLESMAEHGGHRAIVLEDGNVVGIISPSDVTRLIAALKLAESRVELADTSQ